jgi:hypothetical protein
MMKTSNILDVTKSKQEPALHEQEASTAAFFTAEGIELKPTYSEKILKISITLILVLAFLLFGALLLCMCVALDHSPICWIFNSRRK